MDIILEVDSIGRTIPQAPSVGVQQSSVQSPETREPLANSETQHQ